VIDSFTGTNALLAEAGTVVVWPLGAIEPRDAEKWTVSGRLVEFGELLLFPRIFGDILPSVIRVSVTSNPLTFWLTYVLGGLIPRAWSGAT
jgi:hypothetical protein